MDLFFKPKMLNITNQLLEFNHFKDYQNEFSNQLDQHLNTLFTFQKEGLKLVIEKSLIIHEQGFKIIAKKNQILIQAKTEVGAYYGCLMVKQMLQKTNKTFEIEDYPDLNIRGAMLDISRSKVPKLETLKEMVLFLSKLRYNHLELYIEGFSFEYKSFPNVLNELNYITLNEYLELEKFANFYYIDFVPNQNGFGHMQDWLAKDEYKMLAESPLGFDIWGSHREPSTLDPTNAKSIDLVITMYDDMLPYTKSKYFNMNFDEPYELGYGKSKEETLKTSIEDVYIKYFNLLAKQVKKYQKTPLLFADVVIKCPEKLDKIDKDAIFIDWGYDKDYPFKDHAKLLENKNLNYLLAPGTLTWSVISSRILDMEQTILNSANSAKQYHGLGILVTDWGDIGHLQYLPFSYLGFIFGGLLSWYNATLYDAICYLKQIINDDFLTEAIIELGKYHQLEGEYRSYGSQLFSAILWAEHSRNQKDQVEFYKNKMFANTISDSNLKAIKISFEKVSQLLENAKDCLIKDEIKNSLFLLNILVRINEKLTKLKNNSSVEFLNEIDELQKYLVEHKRLWLMRNIQYGYPKSANRIHWLIEILTKLSGKENLC